MVSLAGLSAAFPGYQEAQKLGDRHKLDQAALTDIDLTRGGHLLAGQAMNFLIPGAQPMPGMGAAGAPGGAPQSPPMMGGAPPPMQPGQASVPMQQPGFMGPPMSPRPEPPPGQMGERWPAVPMGAGDQRLSQALEQPPPGTVMNPGRAPTPQGPPMPGGPPMGGQPSPGGPPMGPQGLPGGPLGLDQAIAAINRANPNAPPELKFRALSAMAPLLRMDDRNQLMYMNALLRQQETERKWEQGDRRLDQGDRKLDQGERALEIKDVQGQEKLRQGRERLGQLDKNLELVQKRFEEQHRHNLVTEAARAQQLHVKEVGTISDEAADYWADVAKTKGSQALTGLGPANRAKVIEAMMKKGIKPEEVTAAGVALMGHNQYARSVALLGSRVDWASKETDVLIPQALKAFNNLSGQGEWWRQYPDINALINTAAEKLGDPKVVAARNALLGLRYAYALALNRGYQPSVTAQENAGKAMNINFNQGQFQAMIDQVKIEIANMERVSGILTDQVIERAKGGAGKPASTQPAQDSGGWSVEPVR